MKHNLRVLIYSAVLGLVCAGLLTGVAEFTEPYRMANAKAEETRHILSVLGVPYDPKAAAKELENVYQKNVQRVERGGLEVFEYVPPGAEGKVVTAAVPFSGQGVWGPIKGFLALQPDMKTIYGITFNEQEETPGLGGEIATPRFCDQFKGKTLVDAHGQPGMRIGSGAADAPNRVDAISGATMTSNKVQDMLNTTIDQLVRKQDENGK